MLLVHKLQQWTIIESGFCEAEAGPSDSSQILSPPLSPSSKSVLSDTDQSDASHVQPNSSLTTLKHLEVFPVTGLCTGVVDECDVTTCRGSCSH